MSQQSKGRKPQPKHSNSASQPNAPIVRIKNRHILNKSRCNDVAYVKKNNPIIMHSNKQPPPLITTEKDKNNYALI